jgi:dihydrofolate reductase
MTQLRVHAFSVSLDGYGAGPNQSVDAPLGEQGEQLHEWIVDTRTFRDLYGPEGGETGVDDDLVAAGFDGIGAWILGRNMFGPVRGDWPDDSWKGWWGDNPPYHCSVFVLTHHPRESIEMDGGTTFHFVTDGIEEALDQAKAAAGDLDVRLGGGAETIKQYMRAGLLDSMHIAIVPVMLGDGERLLDDLGDAASRYVCTEWVGSAKVTHAVLTRVD